MAEDSAISWTDSTFNPWIGCTQVSPACERCYAMRDNAHRKWAYQRDDAGAAVVNADGKRIAAWGTGAPRTRTSAANWNGVRKWQRDAPRWFEKHGRRRRVFVASLADVFDNEVPQEWRDDLWALMEECPDLHWIPLTKRIGNVANMVPQRWLGPWPQHIGLMATIADQEEWDRDYRKLARWKGIAAWIGVSVEPMLGLINIGNARPDWIITGGESGPGFRELDMAWPRSMEMQCAHLGITYHHKQNGGLRGKDAGCLIDGREYKHFPPALAA